VEIPKQIYNCPNLFHLHESPLISLCSSSSISGSAIEEFVKKNPQTAAAAAVAVGY